MTEKELKKASLELQKIIKGNPDVREKLIQDRIIHLIEEWGSQAFGLKMEIDAISLSYIDPDTKKPVRIAHYKLKVQE